MLARTARLAALLVPLTACFGSDTSPPPSLAGYVPEDAVFFVVTERMDAIREAASQSTWFALFQDERLGLGQIWDQAAKSRGQQESQELGKIESLLDAYGGAAVFYVPKAPTEHETVVTLLEPEGDVDAFATLLVDAIDTFRSEAVPSEPVVREVAGTTVTDYRFGAETATLFEANGVIALVSRAPDAGDDAVTAVLARLRGEADSGSILDRPSYLDARPAGPAPVIEAHLQIPEMLEMIGKEPLPDDHLAHKLGIGSVSWVHAAAYFGAGEELGMSFALEIKGDTPIGRVANFLGEIPTEFLSRLPGESRNVGMGSYDLAELYIGVRVFLKEHYPEQFAEMQTMITESEQELGFDVDRVIRTLTGRWASFEMPVPPEEMPEVEMMASIMGEEVDATLYRSNGVFLEHQDVDLLRAAIDGALAKAEMTELVQTSSHAGIEVFQIVDGPQGATWAFVDGGVIASLHRTPVIAFLDLEADGGLSAADDPVLAEAVSAYSDSAWLHATPTTNLVGDIVSGLQLAAMMVPVPGLDPMQTEFLNASGAEIAGDHFEGATVTGVRRNGDSFEYFMICR